MKLKLVIALLLLIVLLDGCASRPKVKTPPIPVMPQLIERVRVARVTAAQAPVTLRGCAWDYDPLLPGMIFEVWSSTNLVSWVLATNTTEKIALFPVKTMEFYRVRARDPDTGNVSDWATVRR